MITTKFDSILPDLILIRLLLVYVDRPILESYRRRVVPRALGFLVVRLAAFVGLAWSYRWQFGGSGSVVRKKQKEGTAPKAIHCDFARLSFNCWFCGLAR